jgi:hypothetical protein
LQGTYYRSNLPKVDIQGILMDGKQENIKWEQYMRPERVEDMPGALPLSKLREIETQVSKLLNVQERHRLRKTLRQETLKEANPSATLQIFPNHTFSKPVDSVEQLGDLGLKTTINKVAIRFREEASIIWDVFDIPDFDICTNGVVAFKALSRIVRDQNKGMSITFYYPDEYPILDNDGREWCGECGLFLEGYVTFDQHLRSH